MRPIEFLIWIESWRRVADQDVPGSCIGPTITFTGFDRVKVRRAATPRVTGATLVGFHARSARSPTLPCGRGEHCHDAARSMISRVKPGCCSARPRARPAIPAPTISMRVKFVLS